MMESSILVRARAARMVAAEWGGCGAALQAEPGRPGRFGACEQDRHRWHHPARGQVHQPVTPLPGAGVKECGAA